MTNTTKVSLGAVAAVAMAVAVTVVSLDKETCAASSGSNCEQLLQAIPEAKLEERWAPAPMGNTLGIGKWRGGGCCPKECVDTGKPWPAKCQAAPVAPKPRGP